MDQVVRNEAQLAAALRRQRKTAGLTQVALAASMNKRQATISALETGEGATLDTLFSVLAALELELVVRPRTRARLVQGDLF